MFSNKKKILLVTEPYNLLGYTSYYIRCLKSFPYIASLSCNVLYDICVNPSKLSSISLQDPNAFLELKMHKKMPNKIRLKNFFPGYSN